MGELSRDHARSTSHASRGHQAEPVAITPEQRAAEVVTRLTRTREELDRLVTEHATTRNRREWHVQREELTKSFARVDKDLATARSEAAALPDALRELSIAAASVEATRLRMLAISAPPAFVMVSREDEIQAALDATIAGSRQAAFGVKEERLGRIFASLDPTESRVLLERIQHPVPEDAIARAIHQFVHDRRKRLLGILADAPRRAAMQAAVQGMADEEDRAKAAEPADVFRVDPRSLPEAPVEDRKKHEEAPVGRGTTAHYLMVNSRPAWNAIASHLRRATWPDPPERFEWRNEHAFLDEVLQSLHDLAPELDPERFAHVLQMDVHTELLGLLPLWKDDGDWKLASQSWVPAVGTRIGQLLQEVMAPSIQRMMRRYIDVMDSHAKEAAHAIIHVRRDELVTSAPIDRIVANGLAKRDVALVVPDGSRRAPRTTLRAIVLRWERDPKLWNFVRAEPGDASVEEVAASLFAHARGAFGGEAPSFFAYGLAAAPPLFGVPVSWALKFPEAAAHAPASARTAKDDSVEARLSLAASSAVGDELALVQTPKLADDVPAETVSAAAADVLIQLELLHTRLAPWRLGDEIVWARVHCEAKRDELAHASPKDVQVWAPVVLGQRQRLAMIAGSITPLLDSAASMGSRTDPHHPLRGILTHYTHAAACSHLAGTCADRMADAQREQARLTLRSLQANELAMQQAMGDLANGPAMHHVAKPAEDDRDPVSRALDPEQRRWIAGKEAAKLSNQGASNVLTRADEIAAHARSLENQLARGGNVEPEELQRVQLDLQEQTIIARCMDLSDKLEQVDEAAAAVNASILARIAALPSYKFSNLRDMTQYVRKHIVQVRRDLVIDQQDQPRHLELETRRRAVARAQHRLADLQRDQDLGDFIRDAYEIIDSQKLRTALLGFLVMAGISIATAGLGSMAGASVEGGLLAAEGATQVAGLSTLARTQIMFATVGTEAVGNATAQTILQGDSFGRAFVENALLSFGSEAIVGRISKDVGAARAIHTSLKSEAARIAGIEARAVGKMGTAARVLARAGRELVSLSGHTVFGLALGQIASHTIDTATGQHHAQGGLSTLDVALQGISVAIGKMVHARLADRKAAHEELAQRSHHPEARNLPSRRAELEALTHIPEKLQDPAQALIVLEKQRELIEAEMAIVDDLVLAEDHGGYKLDELHSMREDLGAQRSNLRDSAMVQIQLQLHGLHELVPGSVWSGTKTEISDAIHALQRDYPDARIESGPGTTTVTASGKRYEFHERATVERTTPQATTRPPDATHELSTSIVAIPGTSHEHATPHEPTSGHRAADEQHVQAAIRVISGHHGIVEIKPSTQPRTYLVKLTDGTWTSIEIVIVRVDGSDTGRLVPNTSRVARVDGHVIEGEHVLQVSPSLPPADVERVVASGMARLVWMHQQANPSTAHPHGRYANEGSFLSSDDRGRAAEIQVLAHRIAANDAHSVRAQADLAILTEYLGLRLGTPEAHQRRAEIEALAPDAREALEASLRTPLSKEQRATIDHDLAASHAQHLKDLPLHDGPHAIFRTGEKLANDAGGREQLRAAALIAEVMREHRSQQTLDKLRTQIARGHRPHVKVQRGGGASLAGRDPSMLLVDDRGRWQADGSENLAQVGQQMQELHKSRFGDIREAAGPSERVPLDAIRYWEDSLAIQGDVINGRGTYRVENGQLVMDIHPSDGTTPLTVAIDGPAISSTGFPSEMVPGAPRNFPASEALLALRDAAHAQIGKVDGAQAVYDALGAIETATDADLPRMKEALDGASAELITAMQAQHSRVKTALDSIDAHGKWNELVAADKADGKTQIFMGIESNNWRITQEAKANDGKSWVFAGAGGNAVSAAEIVLANTNASTVTLVGRDTPDGLLANRQFRDMAEAHGDAQLLARAAELEIQLDGRKSDGRLRVLLEEHLNFTTPVLVSTGDAQTFVMKTNGHDIDATTGDALPSTSTRPRLSGDILVSAVGSAGQLPPDIAAIALESRRRTPNWSSLPIEQQPVHVRALFGKDGRYQGYAVTIRMDGRTHDFEVTGAESRFPPREEFQRMGPEGQKQFDQIMQATYLDDAHPKSGVFGGGFAPTTQQTSARHRERRTDSLPGAVK